MTLILNGTDNSATVPAVQGGTAGTTTGVYYPSTNQVAISTAGTQAVLVDASQNVGVGTSSPGAKLDVNGTVRSKTSTGGIINMDSTAAGTTNTLGSYANAGAAFADFNLSANNTIFLQAGTERARINSSGNLKLSTAGTNIQNSSGNPILLQSGSVLKVQQFTDAGSTTTSGSAVNLNTTAFQYTPVSTNSTLYLTITAYAYNYPAAGYAASVYTVYYIGEYISGAWTAISNPGYFWSNQYSTTYAQSIAASAYMTCTRSNSALTTRSFDLMGATSNSNVSFTGANIIFTVMEVAN
jgi:hypothetical protein